MSNTFTAILMNYGGGALDELIVTEMQNLVLEVIRADKAGTLNIAIKVSPNNNTVELDASVNAKRPPKSVGKALFFPDEEGNLLRQDPRQPALPFREITNEPTRIRTIER